MRTRLTGGTCNGFEVSAAVMALLISLLVIAMAGQAAERADKLPVIYAVEVIGNRVTSERFIKHEMSLRPGMTATPEQLEADRLHLESLGLFNHVEVRLAVDEGRAVVLVTVTEPLFYYLFPVFEYDFDAPDRTVYGGGFHHRNVRGRGETITLSGWTGFNRGGYIDYNDPWFRIRGIYSLSWRVGYSDRDLATPDGGTTRREKTAAGLMVRRRLQRDIWLGIGLEWTEQRSDADFYTHSDKNRDRLVTSRLVYEDDHRDYRYYPSQGHFARLEGEASYILEDRHHFLREKFDVRAYRTFGGLILAARLRAETSQRQLPYYSRLVLSRSRIRAGSDYGAGGWTTVSGSFEVRFNVFPLRYVSLGGIPVVGSYLLNMPFSIEGVLFSDAGYSRYDDDGHAVGRRFYAWGGGLQFQMPYVHTSHVLIGWTPHQRLTEPSFTSRMGVTF